MPFTSRRITVAGLRTFDRHDLAAPRLPVVQVHGLGVSHRYLMPTAHALAGRHPVLVPDLPGFGHSDKPRHAYDVGRHAAHLAAWLDVLGLGPVCLAGHSFGAEVVARVAALRPDLVAALVLAGPTTDPLARSRRGLIGRWLLDLLVEAPWQAAVIARDVADAKPWRVLATVGHSVRNQVERDLRRLRVRPLILGGALDPIATLRWRASVAALTGGVSVTVPEAAHNLLTTSPRRSADAIAAYVAGHSPTGPPASSATMSR